MDYKAIVEELYPQVVAWRRHFHQHPEISWEEYETSAYVKARLEEMGLTPRVVSETGLVADIVGEKPRPTIALRADIDALPIQELVDVPYKSRNAGLMHACGHDAHTAMLLGAASFFATHRDQVTGTVRLIFQPAEETPPPEVKQRAETGALAMVEGGAMDGVDLVVGQHIINSVPHGVIGLVPGPIMAGSMGFDVKITGKGGHAGMPAGTVDALATAAHAVVALRSAATLSQDPTDPLIIHVGKLVAGEARTAVAASASFSGTVRFTAKGRAKLLANTIRKTVEGVAAAFGAQVEFHFGSVNEPVINDVATVERLRPLCGEVVGAACVMGGRPSMASEDFWAFLDKAPGAFVIVGGADPQEGAGEGHHSPYFRIAEESMKTGLELWLRIGCGELT